MKVVATIAGILFILFGFLCQGSTSKFDQTSGKLIVVSAGLMLALLYFASGTVQKVAQWALCTPLLVFVAYVFYRRM